MHITIVDYDVMADIFGGAVNPLLSLIVCSNLADPADVHCLVSEWDNSIHPRVVNTFDYLDAVYGRLDPREPGTAAAKRGDHRYVVFQAEDVPENTDSVSWEAKVDWSDVGLVPDYLYFARDGYVGVLPPGSPDLIDWPNRVPSVVWRGSTTGAFGLTSDSVEMLPRYRLCVAAKSLGRHADVGISGVAQAEGHEPQVTARLDGEGLLRPYRDFTSMAKHKYIVDIDGNSNSWNFPAKLRLGACVLKVEGEWRQWFSHRLIPWKHYVPVCADLSDFVAQVEWCLAHDEQARQIGEAGRDFALNLDFEEELRKAAAVLDEKSKAAGASADKPICSAVMGW